MIKTKEPTEEVPSQNPQSKQEEFTEISTQIEYITQGINQLMQIGMMLNQQLTLTLNGLNNVTENQLELGKLFSGDVPEELEMYKVSIPLDKIELLNIKPIPKKEDE